jgi:hypothetical protein
MTDKARLSLADQAALLEKLFRDTFMTDGAPAGDSYLHLTRADGDELAAIARRLRQMAPHEKAIRMIVTAR